MIMSQAYEDAFNHNQDPIAFLVDAGRQLKAGMSAEWKVCNMQRVYNLVCLYVLCAFCAHMHRVYS